ncbi:hypothetical protein P153DRAFT_371041 [Dothidotthia symphoricarpi CBS 119687]|uniref:Ornithine decarboxylase antizyme n=1 Tax=Dothidotthia symphoricarpi CBS 119687 TaxID=1392245 RepID=A0A6A5ZX52_9PLEO|nr:uncharacterized protein P153DRAFT_371041 [Dothidotthia symphoricarpi CBS 119687]KAF2124160.1 hypothetical protein P153DRAFT_371041 [Dothidotthia symphoricarpi CBS 119687]
MPEVGSGIPSPPPSPPLGKARRGGAAYTITGECERLFCDTLRAVFLGEGMQRADSLVMGMQSKTGTRDDQTSSGHLDVDMDCAIDDDDYGVHCEDRGNVSDYIEMWDYVGGIQFRGFVAQSERQEKAMFVFFDEAVINGDLKAGLMALLELCALPYFSCDRLVVCIDRAADQLARDNLAKDLGWIGFGLTTLKEFTRGEETSEEWLFMEMET